MVGNDAKRGVRQHPRGRRAVGGQRVTLRRVIRRGYRVGRRLTRFRVDESARGLASNAAPRSPTNLGSVTTNSARGDGTVAMLYEPAINNGTPCHGLGLREGRAHKGRAINNQRWGGGPKWHVPDGARSNGGIVGQDVPSLGSFLEDSGRLDLVALLDPEPLTDAAGGARLVADGA